MFIPKETIDIVRDQSDIIQVLSRYISSIKKTGRNYTALCPFHNEKTPSFSISPDKGFYHCYGCHESGNVFTFVSKIEGITFPEAVKRVADISGIVISTEKRDAPDSDYYYRVNSYAAELYYQYLLSPHGEEGHSYFLSRGITEDSIRNYQLGYAPPSWDFLFSSLQKKNISLDKAMELGLISQSQKQRGKYYDRFRNRVIFPITESGKVKGFGARTIGDDNPKYLNSQESDIYQKRVILYGLDQAREEIRKSRRTIIVEGYLDVIGLHQGGIKNVVAPLGTSLTEQHVDRIARMCDEVILLFDGDEAGKKASAAALPLFKKKNCIPRVAILEQSDPFEYIEEHGMRNLMVLVDQAVEGTEYQLKHIANNHFPGGDPSELVKEAFTVIDTVELDSRKDHYIRLLGELLNLDISLLKKDYFKLSNGLTKKPSQDRNTVKSVVNFRTKAFIDLLGIVLMVPTIFERIMMDFDINDIDNVHLRNIFEMIRNEYTQEEGFLPDKLFDIFTDGEELVILKKAAAVLSRDIEADAVYTEIYLNLKLDIINKKIDHYAALVKNGNTSQNLITEIEVLRREKEKLSHYSYNRGQ